ncbi:MAG: hypothetical protein RL108_1898 [Bacteroidota bacterium]|jgi:hypothetical protein
MEQVMPLRNNALPTSSVAVKSNSVSIDVNKMPNAVLRRLIDEVKFENQNNITAYNRTHNRHNRGR